MDKLLTHLVQGRIVEVVRLEGSGIYHGKTWVSPINDMLFDQLHDAACSFRLWVLAY